MSADSATLQVVEQRTVLFYDDQLIAVRTSDDRIYIPIRPICDLLGIDWSAQRRRILRDEALAAEAQRVAVTTTSRGDQEMLCLPHDMLGGFLFGISTRRVKPQLQERLIRYRRECYRVLHEAFSEGRLTVEPDFEQLLAQDTAEVQAYRMAMAVAKMARQQIMLRAQVDSNSQRLERIEAQLGDSDRLLDNAQASRISQAVKAIAIELGKRSGRNEFGGVYGELYRRFDISGYRELPAGRYREAIHFLNSWYSSLTDSDLPF